MTRTIASAVAIAAAMAGNAFADDIAIDPQPLVLKKSRAEVQADLKKPGTSFGSSQYGMPQVKSGKSSKQLMNEYVAARREVAAFNGEDSGSAYLARTGSPRNRATMGGSAR